MSKVALVEDDPTMRSLLTTLLQLEGFQVVAYGIFQEEEILAKLQADRPDVLLLDVHLSSGAGNHGIDILRHIKQIQPLQNLRVIMQSGMDVRERCLQAGADGFLMKPYMPDELIALIRQNNH